MKGFRAAMLLGASVGALMATVETLDVIGRYGELLYGPGEGAALAAEIFAAAITMGALLGLALGAVAWLVARPLGKDGPLAWGARLNREWLDSPEADRRAGFLAGFITAAGLCVFLYLLSRTFLTFPLGPSGLAPFVLAVAGCVALGMLARRALGPRGAQPANVPLSGTFWSVGFLAAGVFALLYVIDRDQYVRLYTNVHLALAALAFLCLSTLLAVLVCAATPERMRFPRAYAIVLGTAWLATAAFTVARFNANDDVKAFLFNRTTYAKRIYPILARAVPSFRPRPLPDFPPLPAPPTVARASSPDLKGANLILITIDALRADHVGVYGSARSTTPCLDHFARRAVMFRRAYAQGANTFPSISSLMTGRYPSELKWIYEAEPPLPEANLTLAEILRDAHYDTAAVTPHPYFARKWGLPQGFVRQDNSAGIYNKDNRGIVSKRIEQNSEAMLSRLRSPFFFWAHFYDPHAHYMPRPVNRFGDRAVDLYDGEIAETDAWIGKLLRWIGANVKGSTVIAITADHGDEFSEHGGQFHGTTLYEEIVHVPLLIRVPGAKPAAVSTPVRLIDLVPTFLDLLRVPVPPHLSGRSLGSVFAGQPLPSPTPPVFSEANQLAEKVMVLRDHQKLIYDRDHGTWELYDLRVDPGELRNRIGIEPSVAQSLKRLLVPWARSHR